MTANDFQPEMVNNTTDRMVTTSMYGLNGTWKPADKWSLAGDLYRSKADRPEGGQDTFVTAGSGHNYAEPTDTLYFSTIAQQPAEHQCDIPPSQLGLTTCPKGTASAKASGHARIPP